MTVEMDDADALGGAVCDAAHARKADRVVAAQHDRQCARTRDMRHASGDLIEAFFQVGGNGEDVASITQRHLFAQIDA